MRWYWWALIAWLLIGASVMVYLKLREYKRLNYFGGAWTQQTGQASGL